MKYNQLIPVIWERSKLNLKSEASTNYLSYVWWILDPLIQVACYYAVFELLLNRGGPGYALFLLVGLVPWLWFSRCINQCASCLLGAKALTNQLNIPKVFFPGVVIVQASFKQMFVFIVFLLLLASSGQKISFCWFTIPLLILVQVSVLIPCSFFAALIVVNVNDLKYIVPTCVQFLFFFSGIFFDVGQLSEFYQTVVLLNPMAGIIDAYRDVLLYNQWPSFRYLFFVFICGVLSTCAVVWIYVAKDKEIARLIHR